MTSLVDDAGRLVGIVSRADLLRVFIRTDEAIWRQIMDDVIARDFMLDPSRFFIDVVDGVVVLQGRVARSRLIPLLVRAVHAVEGVVRVEDRLTFDVDDRDADLALAYPGRRPEPWLGWWPPRRASCAGRSVAQPSRRKATQQRPG